MSTELHKVKAVLFDLDETLIDAPTGLKAAHRVISKKIQDYLTQHGVKIDEGLIRSRLRTLDDRMNLETKYNRDAWWPVLFEELAVQQKLSRQSRKELTRSYWKVYAAAGRPYADAEPTLTYLKQRGYKLGLVTDTDGTPGMKRRRAEHLKVAKLFDVTIISGEDTVYTKPSPEPFLLAASRLGLPVSECVFVGDKPFTDIRGAKAAGMRTIWLKRRDWGVEEPADFTINSLTELCGIL